MKPKSADNTIAIDPIQKAIDEKIALLKALQEDLPAIIIVHDLRDTSVLYMSPRGLKILGISMQELSSMGADYHDRFFNVEFAQTYMPKILGLMERNMNDEVISFFQQVRSSPEKEWTWYMTCTKIFLRDEEGKPLLIISNAVPMDTGHYIDPGKAQRLLDENIFLHQHNKTFTRLTKREKEILKMMALGYSSIKMGEQLHISEKTATTHRRNIKRKLKIESNYDISRFAHAFDLV